MVHLREFLESPLDKKVVKLLKHEGLYKGQKIKFDPEQVKMGTKVEMEHTNDPAIAKQIALDHLVEIPDYYTRLKKMEAEARRELHLKSEGDEE